ncbi:septation protein SepH [Mycolicibacterium vaccae]|uniref:septation protein SepH n=1 Tax=Mycolicibacterium vaccae TaxID=1810 RepID=UPI003D079B64
MRELKVVGLDVDGTRGTRIICETDDPAEKFVLRNDERLRAAVRGDQAASNQTTINVEVPSMLRPKEIQSRIRAGASVEQIASAAGVDVARVERFAHPVLLERARAAELATAAHPVLADGPSVLTLLETVTAAMIARGLDPDAASWDAWRNEDGRWTVQLAWTAGRSDLQAHFRYAPGAHGGTVTAFDENAAELIDPSFRRTLRPLAPVAQLALGDPEDTRAETLVEAHTETTAEAPARPETRTPEAPAPAPAPEPEAAPAPKTGRARKARPAVPAWEDVLLGVRSSGGER